jgi:hypothetical protein
MIVQLDDISQHQWLPAGAQQANEHVSYFANAIANFIGYVTLVSSERSLKPPMPGGLSASQSWRWWRGYSRLRSVSSSRD